MTTVTEQDERNIELFARYVAEKHGPEAVLQLENPETFSAMMDEYNEHIIQMTKRSDVHEAMSEAVYMELNR